MAKPCLSRIAPKILPSVSARADSGGITEINVRRKIAPKKILAVRTRTFFQSKTKGVLTVGRNRALGTHLPAWFVI